MRIDDRDRPAPLPAAAGRAWPVRAQVLVSLGLLYHSAAILAAALGASPSSAVERRAALLFKTYYELICQGFGYHYYARLDTTVDPKDPRPWGTPVVIARLEFEGAEGGGGKRVEV